MTGLSALIGQAVLRKQLTKAQGSSLLRHRTHDSEGHMLFMMKLMIEKQVIHREGRGDMAMIGYYGVVDGSTICIIVQL